MKQLLLFFTGLMFLNGSAQLLVQNTTIVDVENKKLVPGQDVLIEGDKITAIGQKLSWPTAKIIDGSGKYLMPGLVDAHVHFFSKRQYLH